MKERFIISFSLNTDSEKIIKEFQAHFEIKSRSRALEMILADYAEKVLPLYLDEEKKNDD